MDYRHIILTIIGGGLGYVSLILARALIKQREGVPDGKWLDGAFSIGLWVVFGILAGFGIGFIKIGWVNTIEIAFLFLILLSLSLVDAKIRKIPNQLLLALIVLRLIMLTYGTVFNDLSGQDWLMSALGLAFGWFLFSVPSAFGLMVGWGDVKFAAVGGFYLGIVGLVQALLVMSIIILIYGLVLVITKKGSFKSAVAYGPALSVGFIVALLFPIAELAAL